MDSDGRNVEISRGVLSYWCDGNGGWEWSPVENPGGDRSVSHQIINSEADLHHCNTHLQQSHILTMHREGKNYGIQKIHEVMGSRYWTGCRVNRKIL